MAIAGGQKGESDVEKPESIKAVLLQWSRLHFSQLHVCWRILMNLFIIVVRIPSAVTAATQQHLNGRRERERAGQKQQHKNIWLTN